jgi:hypothetical protein
MTSTTTGVPRFKAQWITGKNQDRPANGHQAGFTLKIWMGPDARGFIRPTWVFSRMPRERERERKKKIERKREKRKRRRDMNELLGFDIANNLIIDTLTLSNLTDSGAQQLAYML